MHVVWRYMVNHLTSVAGTISSEGSKEEQEERD